MKSAIACLLGLTALLCGTCAASSLYQFTEDGLTMLEEMDLVLEVPYEKTNNSTGSVVLKVENAAVYEAGCSLNTSYAVLQLQFGNLLPHNVTQTFKSDGNFFWMEEIVFEILHDPEIFKDAKDDKSVTFSFPGELFNTSLGNSYACNADVTEQIAQPKGKPFNMTFSNMKLQPFDVTDAKFSAGKHCAEDPGKTTPGTTPGTTNPGTNGTTIHTTPGTMGTTTGFTEMTTSAPATTHLAPTTKPPVGPTLNKLNVTHDGHNCIMEEVIGTFEVTRKNGSTFVVTMNDAIVDQGKSRCGNKSSNESAILFATFGKIDGSTLRQEFAVNGDKYYYLKRITLSLIGETSKKGEGNITFDVVMDNNNTFQVTFGKSLKCNSNTTITNKTKDYSVRMYFYSVRLQAFDIKNDTFSTASSCPADNAVSNIVPIAVGCALAVLVIIVLVAYLIGRRNSSRAGYESV
ncbi:Lysosome-associated membrane glycoprotein 1 [Holothuria leucospilota]|uniref:Lysosome-associated membrane glycoprotein 5 n=1 Tax=Holothuria leucospilota TaxID=206669 RepID=A0A9Q1BQI6_HOLLE|nr:Lysosome-associated membrane glycoprotein 1 [Holothuria leucospilota]